MKLMNKKLIALILIAATILMFAVAFTIWGMGLISGRQFVMIFFIACVLTLVGVVTYLYKFPIQIDLDAFDPDSVKVPRTIQGTIVEVISGMLCVSAIAMSVISHTLSDTFSLFLIAIFLLGDVYMPSSSLLVGKLRNVRQVILASDMYRVLALEVSVLATLSCIPGVTLPQWLTLMMVVIIAVTFAGYRIAIRAAR